MNYRKEHIIYATIWLLVYVSPLANIYMRMSSNPFLHFSWHEVYNSWMFITIWFVMFFVHNFFVSPELLVKRRAGRYMCLVLLLLLAGMYLTYTMRPPLPMHPHRHFHPEPYRDFDMPMFGPLNILGPGEIVSFFGGLMLMGLNIGVKLYFKQQQDREQQDRIAKRNLEQQMEYLKYQVNPHFFMNTLNNIHALVDIDPERAKTTIVKLSKMMRHLLYEDNKKFIPLSREVEFLNHYIQLMRLRYTERVHINIAIPQQLPERQLPPLLLIIFVENAFKHGISYRSESFVDIGLTTTPDRLLFSCRNSKPSQPQPSEAKGGMGLQNVRQRLDLIFGNDYSLDIEDGKNEYAVRLDIPLT